MQARVVRVAIPTSSSFSDGKIYLNGKMLWDMRSITILKSTPHWYKPERGNNKIEYFHTTVGAVRCVSRKHDEGVYHYALRRSPERLTAGDVKEVLDSVSTTHGYLQSISDLMDAVKPKYDCIITDLEGDMTGDIIRFNREDWDSDEHLVAGLKASVNVGCAISVLVLLRDNGRLALKISNEFKQNTSGKAFTLFQSDIRRNFWKQNSQK